MNKKLLLIPLLAPLFWQTFIIQLPDLIRQFRHLPKTVPLHLRYLTSAQNIKKVDDLRWNDQILNRHPLPQIYYNKLSLIINEYFIGLSHLGPRTFFYLGRIELIPLILLPFSLLGLTHWLYHRSLVLLLWPIIGLIPLITGQTSVYFIFPAGILYLLAAINSISRLSPRWQNTTLLVYCLYSLFLIGRFFL